MKLSIIGAFVMMLTACGSSPNTSSSSVSYPATTTGSTIPTTTTSSATGYGIVQAIDVVPREQSAGIGLGTVAGAVVGGAIGNQVGSGSGRTAATVAGAVGGGMVGHQMEKNSNAASGQVYRVAVRMDNGSMQTLAQEVPPGVQVGDRVRLDNGVIVERFR
ncbi:MAG TPA: glycine zipper 2TM domain-containing protein [Noviherbaspirillum sp.]|nr:glycine zipper 2TM domain-containing protein [Noviherbaspirillum sp.]